jgi:hypothetical protein
MLGLVAYPPDAGLVETELAASTDFDNAKPSTWGQANAVKSRPLGPHGPLAIASFSAARACQTLRPSCVLRGVYASSKLEPFSPLSVHGASVLDQRKGEFQ